jgi:hypothetical protein
MILRMNFSATEIPVADMIAFHLANEPLSYSAQYKPMVQTSQTFDCKGAQTQLVANGRRITCGKLSHKDSNAMKRLANCDAGHYWDTSLNRCEPCPLNTYQNDIGQTTCKMCPAVRPITRGTGMKLDVDCISKCCN